MASKIKQKDIWELILQTERQLKRMGKKVNPFNLPGDVMNSIVREPKNKIDSISWDIRQKMRKRFLKKYGWN